MVKKKPEKKPQTLQELKAAVAEIDKEIAARKAYLKKQQIKK